VDAVLKTDTAVYVIEFKLGRAEDALAQIETKRYYETYLTGDRSVVLLGAGGFADRKIRCRWKQVNRDGS